MVSYRQRCQGCILSAYVFNLHGEHTIHKAELDSEEGRVKIGGLSIT